MAFCGILSKGRRVISMKQFKTAHPSVINPYSMLSRLPILVEILDRKIKESPHWHDYVQIWYCLEGEMRHYIGDAEYIQRPGSCFVILPYIDHTIDTSVSEVTPRFLSLSFTDKFLTDRGYKFFSYFNKRANFEGRLLPMVCELDGDLREAADRLSASFLSEFGKHKDMSFDILAGYLADFLQLLCRDDVDDHGIICIKDRANAITDSIRYMSENIGAKISLDDLCAVACMSRRMYTENFRTLTGTTSAKFLIRLRISTACTLLTFSDKTVSEIAEECGFHDKMRLAHVFAEYIGISPTAYRRRQRNPEIMEKDSLYRDKWAWFDEKDFA